MLDQAQNISKGQSLSVHLRKVGPKWGTLAQYLILGWSPESVQDFLIKLDMKPCKHLVETSIFSLNPVIVRPTKIMNRADKNFFWKDSTNF